MSKFDFDLDEEEDLLGLTRVIVKQETRNRRAEESAKGRKGQKRFDKLNKPLRGKNDKDTRE